jgi:hypothetical protein
MIPQFSPIRTVEQAEARPPLQVVGVGVNRIGTQQTKKEAVGATATASAYASIRGVESMLDAVQSLHHSRRSQAR